jgi:hypothetical protein
MKRLNVIGIDKEFRSRGAIAVVFAEMEEDGAPRQLDVSWSVCFKLMLPIKLESKPIQVEALG